MKNLKNLWFQNFQSILKTMLDFKVKFAKLETPFKHKKHKAFCIFKMKKVA